MLKKINELKLIYINIFKSHKKSIALLVAVSAVFFSTISGILAPILLKDIINSLSNINARSELFLLFYGYSFLLIAKIAVSELKFYPYSKWERKILSNAFNYLYRQVQNNHYSFYAQSSSDRISNKLHQSVMGLKVLIFDTLFHLLPIIFELLLISLSVLMIFGINIFLLLMAGISLYVFSSKYFSNKLLKYQNAIRDAFIDNQGLSSNLISSNKDLKLFNGYELGEKLFSDAVNRYCRNNIRFYKKKSLFGLAQGIPLTITIIVINYFTLKMCANGEITIGDIALINTYLLMVLKPLDVFSLVLRSIYRAYSDFQLCFEFLSCPKEHMGYDNDKTEICIGNICFKNLTKSNILSNISFDILPGEKIAIIGASGSGKTTLINILTGIDDDYSGTILLNNVNIKNIPKDKLRKHISLLSSDSKLIESDIKANVLMNSSENIKIVNYALEKVLLEDTVHSFSHGINTHISSISHILSTGEKQRIKLARMFATNAKIKIFDESTSHLDFNTERKIVDNILSKDDDTIIFITHRQQLLPLFDHVYKICDGKLQPYNFYFEQEVIADV